MVYKPSCNEAHHFKLFCSWGRTTGFPGLPLAAGDISGTGAAGWTVIFKTAIWCKRSRELVPQDSLKLFMWCVNTFSGQLPCFILLPLEIILYTSSWYSSGPWLGLAVWFSMCVCETNTCASVCAETENHHFCIYVCVALQRLQPNNINTCACATCIIIQLVQQLHISMFYWTVLSWIQSVVKEVLNFLTLS